MLLACRILLHLRRGAGWRSDAIDAFGPYSHLILPAFRQRDTDVCQFGRAVPGRTDAPRFMRRQDEADPAPDSDPAWLDFGKGSHFCPQGGREAGSARPRAAAPRGVCLM